MDDRSREGERERGRDREGGREGIEYAQRKLKEIDEELAGEKISFDFDDTLTESDIQNKAKSLIESGADVYIISARQDKEGMFKIADELGINHSKIFATGSNKAKVEKIKELNIEEHYDNNQDVIDELGTIGKKV